MVSLPPPPSNRLLPAPPSKKVSLPSPPKKLEPFWPSVRSSLAISRLSPLPPWTVSRPSPAQTVFIPSPRNTVLLPVPCSEILLSPWPEAMPTLAAPLTTSSESSTELMTNLSAPPVVMVALSAASTAMRVFTATGGSLTVSTLAVEPAVT